MNLVKFLVVVSILFSGLLHAQERVSSIKDSNELFSKAKQILSISSNSGKTQVIIAKRRRKIEATFLNDAFEKQSSIFYKLSTGRFHQIIGAAFQDDKLQLLFKRGNKFHGLVLDAKTGNAQEIEYDFKLRGEEELQTFNYKNKIFLLSIPRGESKFNIYEFELGNEQIKKHSLDLSGYSFHENDEIRSLYDVMNVTGKMYTNFSGVMEMSKVSDQEIVRNPIEILGIANKMYVKKDGFVITVEGENHATYIINVSVPDFDFSISTVKVPIADGNHYLSNSFLWDNKIAQIQINNKNLNICIKDLSNNEILSSYAFEKEDAINDRKFSSKEDLGKFSVFLRQASKDRIGVGLFPVNDHYELYFGGFVPTSSMMNVNYGNSSMSGSLYSPSLNSLNTLPIAYGYNFHSSAVSLKMFLDKNFAIIDKENSSSPFDRVKKFVQQNDIRTEKFILSKVNENIFYGYFNQKINSFDVYKFSDN